VFGGQRYGDSLVPSGGLHVQHALQRGFAVGLRKTTDWSWPAAGPSGCAEGKQVEFCVWWAAVWRHFGTFWRAALGKEILWSEINVHYA